MNLTPYVETLRQDLATAAAAGGPEISRAAELLAGALDPAARMALMEMLSAAADELTTLLPQAAVEVRLRGREPELVVTATDIEPEAEPAPPPDADEGTSRITLRLPETLKGRAEDAAAAEGISVNAWLVRAVSRAIDLPPDRRYRRSGPQRFTGYARG